MPEVLNTEDPKLRKPNQALVVMPEKGKLSANGAKLHLALLYKSQESIKTLEPGRALNLNHMFEAAIGDLAKMVNQAEDDSSNTRKLFKKYLIEMMSTVVRWESPDAKSDVVWEGMPMLSFSRLLSREGKLWAQWQLPGPLLEAMSDPSLYTSIVLNSVAKLDQYSSIALYQILSRYRNNPSGKSSRHPPEWWMDALISTPGIDPKTKKRKPREWRKVKNESINDAIVEINQKTDLEVEMHEYREGLPGAGRNVTSVQFTVRRKAIPNSVPPKIDLDLVALFLRLGVSETLIDNHAKHFTDEQIKRALLKLEARLNRSDLAAIDNPNTYLSKILRDDATADHTQMRGVVNHSRGESRSEDRLSPPASGVQAAEPTPGLVVLESASTKIREELLSMSPQEQRKYAEIAFGEFQQKGMATSSMSRSLQSNTFSGLLLTKMTDIFGTERYGPDWANLVVTDTPAAETTE